MNARSPTARTATGISQGTQLRPRFGAGRVCVANVGWRGPVPVDSPGGAIVGPMPVGDCSVADGALRAGAIEGAAGIVGVDVPMAHSSAVTKSVIEVYRSAGFFASAFRQTASRERGIPGRR